MIVRPEDLEQRRVDRLVGKLFATEDGRAFLEYAAERGYGPSLQADVSERLARCRRRWAGFEDV